MNANDIVMLSTIAAYLIAMLGIGIYYMKKNVKRQAFLHAFSHFFL